MSDVRRFKAGPWPGLVVLALLAAIGAVVVWAAYSGQLAEDPEPTPPLTVAVEKIAPQPSYAVRRTFVGRVEARRESRVGFELAGTVNAVEVDEGDRVEADAALVRLDTARLAADRRAAVAARREAEADVWLAERAYRRRLEAGEPAFSQAAVDEARTMLDRARARVAQTTARLQRIDVDLEKSELRAPFAGVVTERRVDEGDVVPAGAAALVLLERRAPEVRIGLAGAAAKRVAAGDTARLDIGGESFEAEVRAVVPTRDLRARTVDALYRLDAGWDRLNAGDLARLGTTETIAERGAWVPISALSEGIRGMFALFVAVPAAEGDGGHLVARREVEVLHQTADRAFVRGGLAADALVVTAGVHKLAPGMAVRLERRERAARSRAVPEG